MKKKKEQIKDFDFEIGSEERAWWTNIKDRTDAEIKNLRSMLKFNEEIFGLCEKRIEEAKELEKIKNEDILK